MEGLLQRLPHEARFVSGHELFDVDEGKHAIALVLPGAPQPRISCTRRMSIPYSRAARRNVSRSSWAAPGAMRRSAWAFRDRDDTRRVNPSSEL
jgi:hypothetical protein